MRGNRLHVYTGKRLLLSCLGFLLFCPSFFLLNENNGYAQSRAREKIIVSPTPQQIKVNGEGFPLTPVVGLVTGKMADPAAVREVTQTLHDAGVKRIVHGERGSIPHTPVTVWLGEPSKNPATEKALQSLGVKGVKGLKKEGYVLASGHGKQGKKIIVLAGKDERGTFYAAQTFGQIIQSHPGRDWVPGVEIRDWPEMAIRGTIEGFYGPPWSHKDRLSQIAFYGENKMNTYVYAPKDDPYHRDKWREPYPEKRLKQIRELIEKTRQNHVNFIFALSPGKSICYSEDRDYQLLVNKMQTMYDLGVRSFAIFLDDINPNLRCAEDRSKFGDDPNPPAAAQAYLLNRFNETFIQTHEGTHRLITVPTDYWQAGTTPYRERFAELVDPGIIVYWTGIGVIAPTITSEDADHISHIFKHDLLIWDNYPVNDYRRNRLFLGPLVGRDPDLADHNILGLTANPMNEAEASKIPLYTVADYVWNPDAYKPMKSWGRSLKAFGGEWAGALRTFAENSFSSPIQDKESLTLTPLISEFWAAYKSGEPEQAAEKLIREFQNLQQAPVTLRNNLDKPRFLQEVKPYLDKLELYGKAGESAVKMLMAQRENNGETVWRQRLALEKSMEKAEKITKKIASGVIKPFLQKAVAENNNWLGVAKTAAMTTMGTYSNYSVSNMVDGDPSSLYWSNRSPGPGDAVGVDLGDVYTIEKIELFMGSTKGNVPRPNDYIHHGVLEYSTDGEHWKTIISGDNQREITVDTEGIKARYIRYRSTENQVSWVQVREFHIASNKGTIQVAGAPPAEQGSSLHAAADQNVYTVYRAQRAPKPGESLSFQLSRRDVLHGVIVLQDPESPVNAQMQYKDENGEWVTAGKLSGGYTRFRIGRDIRAIRLVWEGVTEPPGIYELIPKWQP